MRKEVLSVSTNVYSRNRRFVRKLRVKGERIKVLRKRIKGNIITALRGYDSKTQHVAM